MPNQWPNEPWGPDDPDRGDLRRGIIVGCLFTLVFAVAVAAIWLVIQ